MGTRAGKAAAYGVSIAVFTLSIALLTPTGEAASATTGAQLAPIGY